MHQTVLFSSLGVPEQDGATVFEPAVPPGTLSDELARLPELISLGVKNLGDRERCILNRRFGLDGRPRQTLEDLGREMGLSRERVRQLERGALAELRKQTPLAEAYEDLLVAG